MSYELAIIGNPRRKTNKRPSKAQLAARRKFVARFGKKRKASRSRKTTSSSHSGVTAMAKRRKRKSTARSAKGRFVKKSRKVRARRVRRTKRRSAGSGRSRPAMGYVVGSRKIRRRKLNPRASRRRRYRRNPLNIGGILNNQIIPAAYGAGGALALNLALSYLPLPETLKTGWARHGVRLLGALGLGWAAEKFIKGRTGSAVAAGALTIVMYDIVKAALAQFAPEISTRLGEFEDVSLSGDEYYSPASYIQPGVSGYLDGSPGDGDVDQIGAYMEGDLDGVGAYMEGDI